MAERVLLVFDDDFAARARDASEAFRALDEEQGDS